MEGLAEERTVFARAWSLLGERHHGDVRLRATHPATVAGRLTACAASFVALVAGPTSTWELYLLAVERVFTDARLKPIAALSEYPRGDTVAWATRANRRHEAERERDAPLPDFRQRSPGRTRRAGEPRSISVGSAPRRAAHRP